MWDALISTGGNHVITADSMHLSGGGIVHVSLAKWLKHNRLRAAQLAKRLRHLSDIDVCTLELIKMSPCARYSRCSHIKI